MNYTKTAAHLILKVSLRPNISVLFIQIFVHYSVKPLCGYCCCCFALFYMEVYVRVYVRVNVVGVVIVFKNYYCC